MLAYRIICKPTHYEPQHGYCLSFMNILSHLRAWKVHGKLTRSPDILANRNLVCVHTVNTSPTFIVPLAFGWVFTNSQLLNAPLSSASSSTVQIYPPGNEVESRNTKLCNKWNQGNELKEAEKLCRTLQTGKTYSIYEPLPPASCEWWVGLWVWIFPELGVLCHQNGKKEHFTEWKTL